MAEPGRLGKSRVGRAGAAAYTDAGAASGADVPHPANVEGVPKPHRDGMPGVNLHCSARRSRNQGDKGFENWELEISNWKFQNELSPVSCLMPAAF